jgi:hypothetical protein
LIFNIVTLEISWDLGEGLGFKPPFCLISKKGKEKEGKINLGRDNAYE